MGSEMCIRDRFMVMGCVFDINTVHKTVEKLDHVYCR